MNDFLTSRRDSSSLKLQQLLLVLLPGRDKSGGGDVCIPPQEALILGKFSFLL